MRSKIYSIFKWLQWKIRSTNRIQFSALNWNQYRVVHSKCDRKTANDQTIIASNDTWDHIEYSIFAEIVCFASCCCCCWCLRVVFFFFIRCCVVFDLRFFGCAAHVFHSVPWTYEILTRNQTAINFDSNASQMNRSIWSKKESKRERKKRSRIK